MGLMYQRFLREAREKGLELVCFNGSVYGANRWGSWGLWTKTMNDEQTDLQRSPKGDAALDAARLWMND
jgi:hypothetical protein